MRQHRKSRRSRTALAVGAAIVLMLPACVILRHVTPSPTTSKESPRSEHHAGTTRVPRSEASSPDAGTPQVDLELQRLSAAPPVAPVSESHPISGELAQQPDLYAAEFVRRLLTQDFRSPRHSHLAWVQAESAPTREPLVVGLVPPDLRDGLAVYSVTDGADGVPPVPTEQEWQRLAATQAFDTVEIQRVTEPLAWTNAVAAGRVTDPGITGREVDALVTRHTAGAPARAATKFSVAITLNLEGPPVRPAWGFVTSVTYTAIPIGTP